MKYPEITCIYCRMGFGALKEHDGKLLHLDFGFGQSSGTVCDCQNPDLIRLNSDGIDDRSNPLYKPEFKARLVELKADFRVKPDDITKENFDFDSFFAGFVECMNWGSIETDDEEYDRDRMTIEDIQNMYNEGLSLYDCLVYYIIPTVSEQA